MKQKRLIYLLAFLMIVTTEIFANNISKSTKFKEKVDKMNLVGKKLLGKVGSICYETNSSDFSVGAEIFLKINIKQEYITITEKEVETTTDKGNDYIKNTYGNEQKFFYKIKDNKIIIDYKNNKSLYNYELVSLEFKNEKIIGQIKGHSGKDKEVVFWEDLTSIYDKALEAKIEKFEYKDKTYGHVFIRTKIIDDNIFFSTGTKTPPCETIKYNPYKKFSYTQQKTYIILHFTSAQKAEKGYKLLLLYVKDRKLFGNVKMPNGNIKKVQFMAQ